jgi:hypothetical protein
LLTKASQDTAGRDIDELLRLRILARDPAGGRSTSYSLITSLTDALHAVAAYTRAHADKTVWNGPALPSPDQSAARKAKVTQLANEIDAIAHAPRDVAQQAFENLLADLQANGFFPDPQLVSAVAFARQREKEA